MSLSDIPGQPRAIEALSRALAHQRLHHAYLFSGPDGVGKAATAFAFAEALLCQSPQSGDGCGRCSGCLRTRARQHPDLHVVEKGQKPDGKPETFIRIERIRALQHELSLKAFEGGRRVVILLEAERMNPQTANALLKTLEEPGQGTYFALVTHAPHLLLPTIVSRCQRLRFAPLPRELVAKLLARNAKEIDSETANLLAALAEGSVTRGLRLAGSPLIAERIELVSLLDPAEPRVGEVIATAERLAQRADELPLVFHLLRSWLRDVLMVHQGGSGDALIHRDLVDRARARSLELPVHELLARLDLCNETADAITFRSANARLAMEAMLLRFAAGAQGGTK